MTAEAEVDGRGEEGTFGQKFLLLFGLFLFSKGAGDDGDVGLRAIELGGRTCSRVLSCTCMRASAALYSSSMLRSPPGSGVVVDGGTVEPRICCCCRSVRSRCVANSSTISVYHLVGE